LAAVADQGRGSLTSLSLRLQGALRTWPDRAGWARLGLEAAWLLPILLALGFTGELMRWAPRFDAEIARLAAVALIAPALGEELLFRAALLPRPPADETPWRAILLSTALFVLWHPPQALLFGPHWARTVLDPGSCSASPRSASPRPGSTSAPAPSGRPCCSTGRWWSPGRLCSADPRPGPRLERGAGQPKLSAFASAVLRCDLWPLSVTLGWGVLTQRPRTLRNVNQARYAGRA
jgi:hypothetical protein